MGKGQRATQAYKSTEFIEQVRDEDGLVVGNPFKLAPSNSGSLLQDEGLASSKKASSVSPAPEVKQEKTVSELEAVPSLILVTTYLSFLMLIVFAHLRDFFGKLFYPANYVQLRVQNGLAPMVSDFESLWTRRLYGRIRDCFNRPITGVAGGHVNLLDRVSHDFNNTF
ncbi:serine palmitoyltransferase component, partial [Coemansia sp. S155-1]